MPRYQDLSLLLPVVRDNFRNLMDDLHEAYHNKKISVWFMPFETYRTPQRQNELYAQGRTAMGKRVTNARAWQSPHQFGLAVDFVPYMRPLGAENLSTKPAWNWEAATDGDWAFLSSRAAANGLRCPIVWDRPHVESNLFDDFRTIIEWREGKPIP